MPTAKTTADLLTEVKARVAAPAANGLLSDADILAIADQEMRTELAALLVGMRSEYWLSDHTTPIVSGTAIYAMPERALGMALRDVTVLDAEGREYDVVQVPASQRYLWTRGQAWAPTGPFAFTLESSGITLLPTPSAATPGWTLRLRYYERPSQLTALANAARVISAPSTTTLDVDSLNPITGYIDASSFVDVVRGTGMHDAIARDIQVFSWAGGGFGFTFTPAITAAQQADIASSDGYPGQRADYVCVAGTTVYPPLPESMWPLLVALTCRAYCEAIGDMRGMEAAAMMYERKKLTAQQIQLPRVDGEVMRPVPMHTPLRGGGRARGRWGW